MWQIYQQEYIAGLVADAYGRLVELYEHSGQISAAIRTAERMINAFPLSETGHAHLIRLLVADGRPSVARSRYDAYAAILSAEDTDTMPAFDLQAMINDNA